MYINTCIYTYMYAEINVDIYTRAKMPYLHTEEPHMTKESYILTK